MRDILPKAIDLRFGFRLCSRLWGSYLFLRGCRLGEDASAAHVSDAVGKLIEAEQRLVATRVNWNLTFQGFMIAAFALVSTAQTSDPKKFWLHMVIACVGIVIAWTTLIGVKAAGLQIDYLKAHWERVVRDDSVHPRPFSSPAGSVSGRSPPKIICWALMLMWAFLVGVILHSYLTAT